MTHVFKVWFIAATSGGLGVWNMICICVGAMLVDKVGRRPIYLISTVGMLGSLCVITGLSVSSVPKHTNETYGSVGDIHHRSWY